MRKSKLEKVAELDEEMRQIANQKNILLQQHREDERKKRTHRICKNGALLESVQPEIIKLTDTELKWLLERCLTTSYTKERFNDIKKKRDVAAKTQVEKPTVATHRNSNTPEPEPLVSVDDSSIEADYETVADDEGDDDVGGDSNLVIYG